MHLGIIVLAIEVVLAGCVKVELLERIVLLIDGSGTVDIDLDGRPQVLQLGAAGVGINRQVKRVTLDPRELSPNICIDVDGRLLSSSRAFGVAVVQAVPVEGAIESMVAKDSLRTLHNIGRPRTEGRAMVADGRSQGGKGGQDCGGLHGVRILEYVQQEQGKAGMSK